jgi:putative ABC transport system permease protein
LGDLVVGGPDLLRALIGHDDPAAASVLDAGGAVAFDSRLLDKGKITIAGEPEGETAPPTIQLSVAGAVAHAVGAPSVLLSKAAADALGTQYGLTGVLLETTRMPTRSEEGRADDVLARIGNGQRVYVERGYPGEINNELLFLVIAAGIVTFGAAGAATGLAIADARPDHVTLAAIGAAPATRRRLAMSSAWIIALLGAILGSATGFVPAIGLLYQRHSRPVIVAIPWLWIAAVLVAVPALAALCAGLFTRSQRVLARRIV